MGEKSLDNSFLEEISLKAKDATAEVRKLYLKIWHASLGAVIKLEQESSKLFAELVKEGEKRQDKLKSASADKPRLTKTKATPDLERSLQALEAGVEKGMRLLLSRLGIPAKSDLDALAVRVEALQKSLRPVAAPRAKA